MKMNVTRVFLDQKKLPGEGGGTVNIVNQLYNLLWIIKISR